MSGRAVVACMLGLAIVFVFIGTLKANQLARQNCRNIEHLKYALHRADLTAVPPRPGETLLEYQARQRTLQRVLKATEPRTC